MSNVTFTHTVQTYNPVTDATTPTVTTIAGNAIQVRGRPDRYKALNLVLTLQPTLFWCPTVYGDTPNVGDATTWAGKDYTVLDIDPIAPDGVTIAVRVILGS